MTGKKKRGLGYWVPAILLLVMVVVVMIEVITRFMGRPIIWGEEIAIWLMIWIIFFGLGYAFDDGGLIAVDYFVSKMKPRTQKILNMNAMVLTIVYFGILLYSSIPYFMYLQEKHSYYPVTKMPSNITTTAIILGCVLAIAFALRKLIYYFKMPADELAAITGLSPAEELDELIEQSDEGGDTNE